MVNIQIAIHTIFISGAIPKHPDISLIYSQCCRHNASSIASYALRQCSLLLIDEEIVYLRTGLGFVYSEDGSS